MEGSETQQTGALRENHYDRKSEKSGTMPDMDHDKLEIGKLI